MQFLLNFLKIWHSSLSTTSDSCKKLLSLRSHEGEPAALRKAKSHLMFQKTTLVKRIVGEKMLST